jgi:hypothetical protein
MSWRHGEVCPKKKGSATAALPWNRHVHRALKQLSPINSKKGAPKPWQVTRPNQLMRCISPRPGYPTLKDDVFHNPLAIGWYCDAHSLTAMARRTHNQGMLARRQWSVEVAKQRLGAGDDQGPALDCSRLKEGRGQGVRQTHVGQACSRGVAVLPDARSSNHHPPRACGEDATVFLLAASPWPHQIDTKPNTKPARPQLVAPLFPLGFVQSQRPQHTAAAGRAACLAHKAVHGAPHL